MSIENISSSEIDYSMKTYSHSSPLEIKISPITSTAPTLDISAPVGPTTIQIPSKVVSLGNSHLAFDLEFASGGTFCHWIQANTATTIDRITLSTVGSNIILADISNVGNYCEAVCAQSTSLSDFLSKPSFAIGTLPKEPDTVLGLAGSSSLGARSCPLEEIQRTNVVGTANYLASNFTSSDGSFDNAVAYNGVRHLFSSEEVGTLGGSGEMAISIKIPFSAFKFTALAIKKLLYFNGESLNLDVYWAPVNRYSYKGTSLTNPITGGATQSIVPTISNIFLYASVEQNVELNKSIVNEVRTKGLRMPIPVVWSSKNNLGAGQQSINLIYTKK